MTTLTTTAPPTPSAPPGRASRPVPQPIPFRRVVAVELRKNFDTRAGFWLLASIGILAVLATTAVVVWAPEEALEYGTFGGAIGIPMAVLLPIVAILSVTSEWSQRTGLGTFTLVPRRGRTIAAKAVGALLIAVVSMVVALSVGALGALIGPMLRGTDPVWDITISQISSLVLAQVLGMTIGFMLGVLLRSSAAAIVAYFVYWGLIPTLSGLLYSTQEWYQDVVTWVDFGWNQNMLYERLPEDATQWAHLGVTGLVWLALPLAFGLWRIRRAEIS
ncbi:ABC transporter permease subunit [Aeromicrobium sp. CTD01-1L150]|uniref:ABC transporter permease subunit n=1 Tax=Aeromicrobium sp. CTD01-1L150 TaxID=3341830 RepID=UPI0035C1D7A8